MMKRVFAVGGLFLVCLLGIPRPGIAQEQARDTLQTVLQRDELTILITDSGLGGLSVCGGIEYRAGQQHPYRSLNLIFCNALPEANYGYNNLESEEKKARVFSDALTGMVQWYHPDLILIACNTLSVVYPHTAFSQTSTVPVLGIVEFGADMLAKKLMDDTSATAIIFGTETTIAANSHKQLLEAKGIASERIVAEACIDLAGEIQSNPNSEIVSSMIEMYVDDAVGQIQERYRGSITAGLCCTHYGYCSPVFQNAFTAAGVQKLEIVNPNEEMASWIFQTAKPRYPGTKVTVSVVSRAPLSQEERNSIASLLEHDSPLSAQALRAYHHKQDLFRFEKE